MRTEQISILFSTGIIAPIFPGKSQSTKVLKTSDHSANLDKYRDGCLALTRTEGHNYLSVRVQ
ncbi:hypothetical protein P4V47_23975 [Brevibacillus laterosporus]|uniref:hypothetical protein n=1 Tax=Brevibacillus TaxID=55080 RepID=UPI0011C07E87|nr:MULTISPECIES: hypothetical protein [Brevibacillus]MED1790485.1 hypothetical protein [Brevibacillus laterosporus]